jgi:hypothetical protein
MGCTAAELLKLETHVEPAKPALGRISQLSIHFGPLNAECAGEKMLRTDPVDGTPWTALDARQAGAGFGHSLHQTITPLQAEVSAGQAAL